MLAIADSPAGYRQHQEAGQSQSDALAGTILASTCRSRGYGTDWLAKAQSTLAHLGMASQTIFPRTLLPALWLTCFMVLHETS